MKTLCFVALIFSFFSSVGFSQSIGQNLIVNGSFEEGHGLTDASSPKSKQLSSLPGWVKVGNTNFTVEYKINGYFFPSQQDAKIWLRAYNNVGVKQTVPVVSGNRYLLSFDFAPRGNNISQTFIKAFVNGTQIARLNSTVEKWSHFEAEIVADAPALEIILQGESALTYSDLLLDNVRLAPLTGQLLTSNLILNSSFEDTHGLTGNRMRFFSELGPWKTLQSPVVTAPFRILKQNEGTINATRIYRQIELDSFQNTTIRQTVTTIAGKNYVVVAHYSPRDLSAGSSNNIEVLVNGVVLGTMSHTAIEWKPFTYNFTANSTSTVLEFRAVGASDGIGGYIDFVNLREQGKQTNLLTNPGFEEFPDYPVNIWGQFTSIPGWTSTTLTTGIAPLEIQYGTETDYIPREGLSKIDLDSSVNSSVYQDIPTSAGKSYLLQFSYSGSTIDAGDSNQAKVYWNGAVIADLNSPAPGWTDHSFMVTGINGNSRLLLRGFGTSDSRGGLIDFVRLREIGTLDPLIADFDLQATGTFPNRILNLDASSTTGGGTIASYTWKFTGPTLIQSANPVTTLTVSSPGFQDITLVVADVLGNTSSINRRVYVNEDGEVSEVSSSSNIWITGQFGQMPPIAIAAQSAEEAVQGTAITFDGSSSFSLSSTIVSYRFVFGDGGEFVSSSPTKSYTYTIPGSYLPFLVVTDANGKTATASFAPVNILAPDVVEANFALTSATGRAPFTVGIDATASLPEGKIAEYYFDFGDGTDSYSEVGSTQHTYFAAGTYSLKLRVKAIPPFETEAEKTATVTVLPKDDLPIISVNTSALQGQAPFQVFFDASLSKDDYGITSYEWDFKDNTPIQAGPQLARISHTFATPGTYQVLAKVKDTINQTVTKTIPVTVLAAPTHLADFTIQNNSGKFPATVTFDASTPATKTDIFDFIWTVNGQTISKKTPVLNYTFAESGTYSIVLKTIDQAGGEHTQTKSITLNSGIDSADFTYSAVTTVAGATYQFDGSLSQDLTAIENFHWDFGEGTVLDLASPTVNHLFTVPGAYQVKLRTDYVGGQSSEKMKTIVVSPNLSPVARLSLSKLAGLKNEAFTVSAAGSIDDEGVVLYELNYGDGSPVTSSVGAISGTHTYSQDGEYTISLRVQDRQGKENIYQTKYTTNDPSTAPVAEFVASVSEGNPKLTVSFDAASSSDDEGIVKYQWNLSNGQSFTKTTPVFNNTFTSPGSYQVSLTVTDVDGFTSQKTSIIRVNSAPVADFVATVDNSEFPATLHLDASFTTDDADGLTYSWSLDEGTPLIGSTQNSVSAIEISQRGVFTVLLKVTDSNGLTSTKTADVRVNELPLSRALVSPMIGDYPLTVNFNGLVSSDDTSITGYSWETLEGEVLSTSPTFQKTYTQSGFYAVKLIVTDSEGFVSSTVYPINVLANPDPVATFSYSLTGSAVPVTGQFDAGKSSDNRSISIYRWNFDGEILETASARISHEFTTAGVFPVTLTVVDDQGLMSSTTQNVTVAQNAAPIASLAVSSSSGTVPLNVVFDASGSTDDETGMTYDFDFGDGSQAINSRSKVAHTYKTPGTFMASVIVKDKHQQTAVAQITVTTTNPVTTDQTPPVILAQIENGEIETARTEIVYALSDLEGIKYSTLQVVANNTVLSQEKYIVEETNNFVRVKLGSGGVALTPGQTLALAIRVTDISGNFASKSFYYRPVTSISPDLEGPVVNFLPKGGDLATLTPTITIGMYDKSGINFAQTSVSLNGTQLPNSILEVDEVKKRVLIHLDATHALLQNQINIVQTIQKDSLGNVSMAGVGYDTRTDKTVIVSVGGLSPIGAPLASPYFNCLNTSGGLKCWGGNFGGTLGLGDGSSGTGKLPSEVGFVNLGGIVKSFSVAPLYSCAILTDDTVRCWGINDYGRLGNGSSFNSIGDDELPSSAAVVDVGGPSKIVAPGYDHNCVLRTDGGLRCWGRGDTGAQGLATTFDRINPASVPDVSTGSASPIIDLIAGHMHTCILNAEGKVKCWGRNAFGQLGQGAVGSIIGDNETPDSIPFLDFGEPVVSITGKGRHICVLLESHKMKCWGSNNRGQLGLGTTNAIVENSSSLPYVEVGENVKQISAADDTTCAITESDKLKCWGNNQYGQLGLGHFNDIGDNEIPSSVAPINLGANVTSVVTSGLHACAFVQNGNLYCWGYNADNQLGIDTSDIFNPNPLAHGPVNFSGVTSSLVVTLASNRTTGPLPLTVQFDATESSSSGTIVSYEWDFGDGTTITETSGLVSHLYQTPGVSIAKVKLTDSEDKTATATLAISVDGGNVLPIAKIASDDFFKTGEAAVFDGAGSYYSLGDIASYSWNFGDGSVITTNSAQTSHTYTSLGLYLATLTVTSTSGATSIPFMYPVFVKAINEAPVAQFSCTPGDYAISCSALTSVDFDGSIESYEWDMGDGDVLVGQFIEHIYSKPGLGKFPVKLTVTDNGGLTEENTQDYQFDFSAPTVTSNLMSNKNYDQAKILYTIDVVDENETITEVWVNGEIQVSTEEKSLDSYLNLQNGQNTIVVKARDKAGNASADLSYSNITAVNSVPNIAVTAASDIVTNVASYSLNVGITDDGATKTSVILNNTIVVSNSSDETISLNLTLQEGTNRIEIVSFDEAKQKATRTFENIILDTTPPRLLSLTPKSGSEYVGNNQVNFNGRASEILTSVTIDSEAATLNPAGTSFSLQKEIPIEGAHTYSVTLTDRAGNTTTVSHTYTMILHILYPELITLVSENDRLKVIGQAGAARFPGQKIEISGGWFNSTEVFAAADGSFEGSIRKSRTVDVSSYSEQLNYTEGHRLLYQNDTTLSGVIRDIAGTPLPGVKVTIVSSNASALTDQSGVFSIPNSSSGDQKIEIDGTLVPESITLDQKKYSRTYLNVTLGNLERNVLEDPIFLTPIYLDGTETVVEPTEGAMVTSARAPGVLIEIPAGAVTFPTGTEVEIGGDMKNVINVAQIDAEKTSVPAPEFAVPEKVYSLEPSGVRFSEPVKLTLPNENEFEDGTPVIIMSKNSDTGMWEIDGSGKANGSSIETDPGQGITHFSEVYAVPYGLEIKSRDNGELPSIDSQSGGLATSIAMPSFKVMGQDVTPSLIYNSGWANPNAVISNVFNLKRDYQIRRVNEGVNIFGAFGGSGTVTQEVWTSPDSVKSKFYVDDVVGQEVVIDASSSPKEAVISYAMDLSALSSGQYFAKSTYEIKYKFITLTTIREESNTAGIKKVKTKKDKDITFDSIFPDPLGQIIYVQNKTQSPYGRGWKLGLTQEILNPGSGRLLVEESNGAPTSYVLDNSIETLVYDEKGIQAAALDSSSSIRFVKSDGKVAVVNVSEGDDPVSVAADEEFEIPTFNVDQRIQLGYKAWRSGKKCSGQKVQGECLGHEYYDFTVGCQDNVYNVKAPKRITDFLSFGTQSYYLDERGAFYRYGSGESLLAGNVGVQPRMIASPSSNYPNIGQLCQNKYGVACSSENDSYASSWQRTTKQRNSNFTPSYSNCGPYPAFTAGTITGNFPNTGYETGTLTQSKFNDPRDVSPSRNEADTFYVADTGNNVVRKIVLAQNSVSDFAGNRQAQGADDGDGGDAVAARIYHPKAVVTDSAGNVYIASESGIIWKVTPENKITMLAGKNRKNVPGDSEVFDELRLENPSGLALDETNKILYVADTNQHRIVAMNLETETALTVAGKYECQSGPDFVKSGSPALDVHLCYPEKIGLDENKNLLVLDKANKMIRRVNLRFTQTGGAFYASTTKDGSKVERLANGSFVRTYRDGTKAYFTEAGKHTSTRDRLSNTTSFEYDEDGRLIKAVDPKGGQAVVGYSGDKISFFRDPANRTTSFDFNGNELVSTTYPDATQKFFEYEGPAGLMSKEYNQRSFATRYDYNIWKRLSKITRPDLTSVSSTETLTSTIANGSTTANPKEAKSYGENNEEGNELVEIYKNAKGIETKFNKDLKGYVSEITDTKGLITKIERDNDGRPTRIDRPDSSYSTFAYNALGDLIESYESTSDTKNTFAYNTDGNPTLVSTEIGGTVKTKLLQYYVNGLVFKETDYNNRSITRQYFGNGLLFSTKNDLDEELTLQYDTKGNLYRRTAPMGEETVTVRDLAGNILQKIDSKGVKTKYTYDAFNRLTSVETGITAQRTEGDLTSYVYNQNGSLVSITDPENNVTSFEYNSMEQLTKKTTHLGQVTLLTYDANGNVATETDPNGNLKTFTYNDSDELIQKQLPDNQYQMTFDDFGNLLTVSDQDSHLEYSYEKISGEYMVVSAKSMPVSAGDAPTVTLNYGYDNFGNRISMGTPFGNFAYSYDTGNRLTGLTNHLSQNFNFAYDNANRLKLITRPGSNTMMDFDFNSFVTGVTHKKGGQIVNQQTFERDALGNKIKITSSRGVANFTYDQDSQLKSATNTEATAPYQSESFNYDSLGNRTNDQLGSFAYDQKKSRLMEDYKYFYAYDNNGNMITRAAKGLSGTVTNYIYSSENQLVEVHDTVGFVQTKSSQYFYDAAGRRSKKIVIDHLDGSKSFERRYVFDGNERLADYDHDNEVLAVHTHSTLRTDDTLSTQITSDGTQAGLAQAAGSYFYLKDSLGTITDVVDGNGNLVQHYVYSSFGKIVKITDAAEQVTTNPMLKPEYTFTNRELDEETGLYYYRARHYEAGIGRFIQEDPHPGSLGDPKTFSSKYIYALNNPVQYIDPNGKIAFLAIVLIGAVVGGTVNALTADNGSFGYNFFIGAIAGAAGAAAGAGVGSLLAGLSGLGGAIFTGALIGGIGSATNTVVQLLLSGEDISTRQNRGRIGTSFAIGAALGGIISGWTYQKPTPLKKILDESTKVNTELIDTGAKKTFDFIFNMRVIECAPLKSLPDNSYQNCMGSP